MVFAICAKTHSTLRTGEDHISWLEGHRAAQVHRMSSFSLIAQEANIRIGDRHHFDRYFDSRTFEKLGGK
jgi:hypothetical protein